MRRKPTHKSASPLWYTAADVANLLDISERCVWLWVGNGKLPPPAKHGRKWSRWPRPKIDRVIRRIQRNDC